MTKLIEQHKISLSFPPYIKHDILAILNKWWMFAKPHLDWFIKQTILVLTVTYFLVPHINRHQQVELQNSNAIDNFVQRIRTLAYQDELTYLYCKHWEEKDKNSSEFTNGLLAINTQRNTEFINLLSIAKNIDKNKLVIKNKLDNVRKFTRWNNTLLYSTSNVCSLELKDSKELQSWTEGIISEIGKKR